MQSLMSYSQRLAGPVCILNQNKILELNKTQGPLTFQRLWGDEYKD